MSTASAQSASPSPGVPVLMYHQVSPRPLPEFRKYTVTARRFATQMRWLARMGYVPVDLDTVFAFSSGHGDGLPARPVVITFDDGYQDCVDHAVPVLQAQGFTATFFLVTGFGGRPAPWLQQGLGVSQELIHGDAARELMVAGLRCGSHTVTHPHLSRLPRPDCLHELVASRCALEDRLGYEVRHLAYPFGSFDDSVRTLAAEAGYRTACSVRTGFVARGDDPMALRRVAVNGGDALLDFVCKLRTGRPVREWLRLRLRGVVSRALRPGLQ